MRSRVLVNEFPGGLSDEETVESYSASTLSPRGMLLGKETIELATRNPGSGITLYIDSSTTDFPALHSTLKVIKDLLTLSPGWDSYGARSIDPMSAFYVLRFLSQHSSETTPVPNVVPTVDGGLQMEWHRDGIDLEVEITPAGRGLVLYRDERTKSFWEGDLGRAIDEVDEALLRLSRR